MVDIGSGRRSLHDMSTILDGKDRQLAGRVGPPQGLILMKVGYERDRSGGAA